jgi:hypothetical protein
MENITNWSPLALSISVIHNISYKGSVSFIRFKGWKKPTDLSLSKEADPINRHALWRNRNQFPKPGVFIIIIIIIIIAVVVTCI